MKIIVGLGNPGPKYETTRHNIGFLAVDALVDLWGARGPLLRDQGEIYETKVGSEKVYLLKPLTFMNLSGRSVAPLFKFHKCAPDDLIVIHDDLDLDLFQLRLKTGGGSGGHNGLKSIDECLGSENLNYHRIRLGIGHPRRIGSPMSPADYVLQAFSDEELKLLEDLLKKVAKASEFVMAGQMTRAMNEFNRPNKPVT